MSSISTIKQKSKTKKPSVIVKAPIILDMSDLGGYMMFKASLEAHTNVQVARAEGKRLTPYFNAMSNYLGKVVYGRANRKRRLNRMSALKSLIEPKSLRGIFYAVAKKMRNTIISDVAILPLNLKYNGSIGMGMEFNSDYSYRSYKYNFGFLQVFRDGRIPPNWKKVKNFKKVKGSSVIFPVFLIDSRITDFIKKFGQKDLLENFQTIMTFVNHDMLHHYTVSLINENTTYPYNRKNNTSLDYWARKWVLDEPFIIDDELSIDIDDDYETWAHIGQEKILLDPDNAHLVEEIIPTLDKYFKGLKELGTAMTLSDQSSLAHEVVDYLGMLMMQAITRVFPLNHPITQGCLDLLELADPAPGRASKDLMLLLSPEMEDSAILKYRVIIRNYTSGEVMKTYERQGFEIFPDNGQANYTHYKMLQLVAMDGLRAHTPGLPSLERLQEGAGNMTLDMLKAAAKTAGYKPKTPVANDTLKLAVKATKLKGKKDSVKQRRLT